MKSLRTSERLWKMIAMKISSSIGLRGAWRKPSINFRMWSRQSNKIVDLRKRAHCLKMKTLIVFQKRNMGWNNPPGYGNELKFRP